MTPKIVTAQERKLVGKRRAMSLTENKTYELWKNFRSEDSRINNRLGKNYFSVQNFPSDYFRKFDPQTVFEKWAAVEVSKDYKVPEGFESLTLPAGLYAVFHYVGSSVDAENIFQFIYGTWLPESGFQLDSRPHFEVLGEKYKNGDPSSEEDIWIPIVPR